MKNAGKACNNRLYRHIRTFEKIIKNYFVISKTPYATLETNVNSSSTSDKVMRIPPFAEASGLCAQKSRPPDACLPVSKTFAVR